MFKNKKKFFIYLILLSIWMIVIFLLSNQVGNDSSSLSNGLLKKIIVFFNSSISNEDLMNYISLFGLLIRKVAHFSEYFLLSVLFYECFSNLNISAELNFKYTILTCMIYSISDEFHQFFIPGRCCSVIDFMVDSLGILAGIYLYRLIKKVLTSKHIMIK